MRRTRKPRCFEQRLRRFWRRARRRSLNIFAQVSRITLASAQIEFGERHIRIYGTVAVDTGYYTAADNKDGQKTSMPMRFGLVFVKFGGKWVIGLGLAASSRDTVLSPVASSNAIGLR